MKTLVLFLASLTMLSAASVGIHTVLMPEGSGLWVVSKIAVSLLVIGAGASTWLHDGSEAQRRDLEPLLLAGSLTLILVGGAGAVWTLHLAEVTGDLEAWALVVNGLLVAQGFLTTWRLWSGGRRPEVSANGSAL